MDFIFTSEKLKDIIWTLECVKEIYQEMVEDITEGLCPDREDIEDYDIQLRRLNEVIDELKERSYWDKFKRDPNKNR